MDLDFEHQAAQLKLPQRVTVSGAAAQWADPFKESATRWHFKASLSPVVDCCDTGHCDHCSCEGLKCLWENCKTPRLSGGNTLDLLGRQKEGVAVRNSL